MVWGVLDGGFSTRLNEESWILALIPFDEDGIPDGLVWVESNKLVYHLLYVSAGICLRMYSNIYIVLYLLSSQDTMFDVLVIICRNDKLGR